MKLFVITAAMLIALATPAHAHGTDDAPEQGDAPFFSPTFNLKDSPVNLILCTTPSACRF